MRFCNGGHEINQRHFVVKDITAVIRGRVEDTTFETKAMDTKKIRCQGPIFLNYGWQIFGYF